MEVDIALPTLSPGDLSALQRCEGRVVFLETLRRHATLREVALPCGGDVLAAMAAYRRRFAAVITRVTPHRMLATPLGVGGRGQSLVLQNTGPFDLTNGDHVCLVPPLLGDECLRLTSANLELRFPMTLPLAQARELTARVVARAAETLRGGAPARGADVVFSNGRRYQLPPPHRDNAEAATRSLVLNMIFLLNEGAVILLSLIPNLLTLGAQDGYANAVIQLGSATRELGQLVRQPPPPLPQDHARRFCVFEALEAWIASASRLGDTLGTRPVARVCIFDGPPTVPPGEKAAVVEV
ncbi:capsid triplex subunit 2 [Suid alphaherpesvirus 1]|uniref:Capsid triplex subunit 2 n=2 Tax=Suid herpesvirus 1 TaxID=10345 RepID=G3G8T3_SUHV|nr:VP23 [Suid alphaherpesvirus 1]7FJ1_1 Chain 1, Triplex capsid protein 2 [Suid alphaherpesvirus 1]7FJ1_2 Chain 2, Triplex capsid protein 2 [Suid alphaherpesvirus 1]7FJ1_3 Chain 3, Triplex capsid protein 2 [Suid alphaherpesvirus 1]7FJ1_j Chain j, Triplex capsid protein 2 [Suid alphaherpesvirus 1]7FJ1_k Chain k, Triplex capsid protein 2 [Suid alphaherpesvirus 1]7FJ1_o Chain o, Triplex capsid protein 2 [Suid alphaherpesvirus 1]7FJ1_s Chain s, Triplex capsid protein 2 [Suid alphaherpesvirus 1]